MLELLPTVAENVIEALPAERISKEIQQKKVERTGRSAATLDGAPSDFSSGTPSATDEDGRSMMSSQSESYVHASQMGSSSAGLGEDRQPKTKAQMWAELKITGNASTDLGYDYGADGIKLSLERSPSSTPSLF